MLRRALAVAACAALAGGLVDAAPAVSATRPGPSARVVRDTLLDPSGIYFVSYDGLVNQNPFQMSGILTYGGYQYVAWYHADRYVKIARRRAPEGAWQTITLPHQLTTDDSHNVISMGISPRDGRIHIAMDTHNTPVFYVKSVAGLANHPATWDASDFGPVQQTLDGLDLGNITYPQFIVTPEKKLQFVYRTGQGSGNGVNRLAEYDGGTWRQVGTWSSATGNYTANGVTSTTRNMYVHGLDYGPDGRLSVAFTWREGNQGVLCAPGGLDNHDIGYVYSDDRGRTWRNSAGQAVGATGTAPVSIDAPGLTVDPIGVDRGLINQEGQAVDSAGDPHVIESYVPAEAKSCVTNYVADRTAYGRDYHLWRDSSGTWHKTQIPVPLNATGRSKIVFDRDDNAYVIMPFGRVVAASRASGWTDWKVLYDAKTLNAFGEVDVDASRLRSQGLLSFMYQQKSTGTTPSAVRVIDFRIGARR
ncbi:BNR repeat-containing protein [Actinoallomurus vinaceus]|uniref:BNR repeat-containing protein n=1 Tax=Actinoallomurus vinaceus TaxID=1080074 RepID=A0ABP8U8S0_9ACTN